MKIPPFTYHRPSTIGEALALLAEHGDDAKILAGGQSLLPLMALRLGRPDHLIDIGALPGLDAISVGSDGTVTIGALVRHADAERSNDLARSAPLVHQAMPNVGHRAIRTRGTVLGSLAHADPAAEMPAVALAAEATMIARSAAGTRDIAAADFFEGYLQTALRADEILVEIRMPAWPTNAGSAVVEESRRHGDYALVGLACAITLDGTGEDATINDAALAFFGADSVAVRAPEAEAALVGQPASAKAIATAADLAMAALNPTADVHASATYRRHLAGVLTRRGLTRAAANATTGVPA